MKERMTHISGNIVDVLNERIYPGTLVISHGRIADIREENRKYPHYIIPGFVDAHIHIESSMLTPVEFARIAVTHGTVAVVSDPHEIANVLGMEGVRYMIENAQKSPLKVFFGAPSCVPATPFETSGACIDSRAISELLGTGDVWYLSEMMNYPGVLRREPEVMAKIEAAKRLNRPIDGHAPGLMGDMLRQYVGEGISTDHETGTMDEALEKLKLSMSVQIREGSAAKDFDALHGIIDEYSHLCMFCSDDRHPDDLIKGHINLLVRKAVALGHDLMAVLRCACVNPVLHYGIDVGLLRKGDPADLVVAGDLETFSVVETWIDGNRVAERGKTLLPGFLGDAPNVFNARPKDESQFRVPAPSEEMRIIHAADGQLVTNQILDRALVERGCAVSDPSRDILKICVVNRYEDSPPALGFVKGFSLKRGAIATSVAHDSHNIVAVGVTDRDIGDAVNEVIRRKGGLAAAHDGEVESLALRVAGLMSDEDAYHVAQRYAILDGLAKEFGSTMDAPFLTLSFMSLLVIPSLKLSDRGLFDSGAFTFVDLFA